MGGESDESRHGIGACFGPNYVGNGDDLGGRILSPLYGSNVNDFPDV